MTSWRDIEWLQNEPFLIYKKGDDMNDELNYRNVRLIDVVIECVKCGERKPASQVGLRTMKDGSIRNQPRCNDCRKYPPNIAGEQEKITKKHECKIMFGHVTLTNAFYLNKPVILYLDAQGYVRNRLKLIRHA